MAELEKDDEDEEERMNPGGSLYVGLSPEVEGVGSAAQVSGQTFQCPLVLLSTGTEDTDYTLEETLKIAVVIMRLFLCSFCLYFYFFQLY